MTATISSSARVGARVSIERFFTAQESDPYARVKFEKREAKITNPDGSVVFQMSDVEIPASWSKTASDVLVSKYFRKGGVPDTAGAVNGSEVSAKQVIDRIASAIAEAGMKQGYFESTEDAESLGDELRFLLINQFAALNSPVWFNCGLKESYGISGDPAGNYAIDERGIGQLAVDGFSRPQVSACFIRTVKDDLTEIGLGIAEEMRIFKYGSGAGANFSTLRARNEKLSGGGTSSGVMSFLKVYDAAAGSVKSGGTTRRAAKMVVLNADHPDIEEFVGWKAREEDKVAALVKAGYPSDFNGEAYATVSGQNSNNSVRVTDEFMQTAIAGGDWALKYRTSGKVAKTIRAEKLLRKIAESAHRCADPGMQFDTTCNKWNTVPNTGRINATNPCSEFSFLDDTACNLASFNLVKFMLPDGAFDTRAFVAACRVVITAMDILVDYASYPTKSFAENSHQLRPLGLGYANLGALLMRLGVPYDSNEGVGICAAITSLMAAAAWRRSAEIAKGMGPFAAFAHNRKETLNVARMHMRENRLRDCGGYSAAISAVAQSEWESAVQLGETHGVRNAQLTLLAPTGTIGIVMDCDTTGIEPDWALVKEKKLAGGGTMVLVNQSVESALTRLGYTPEERARIAAFILNTGGITGAPGLKAEHRAVFQCANDIQAAAHLKMMGAAQPFLCGAISKTVNMPKEATVEDIERAYVEAWKMGLKAVAIYRDGSKGCQPLNTKKDERNEITAEVEIAKAKAAYEQAGMGRALPTTPTTQPATISPPAAARKRLPKRRPGYTQEATISGHKVYLRTGEYQDGRLGEIFIDMHKEGATIKAILSCFAISTSLGLQHGVPLDEFVDAFTFTKFEPSGSVQGDDRVKSAMSVVDYIFRHLAVSYLGREDLAHAKPDKTKGGHDGKTEKVALPPHVNGNGNGNGNGAKQLLAILATSPAHVREELAKLLDEKPGSQVSVGSSEPCSVCGNATVRAGTCAFCLSCGTTTGCG